MPCRVAGCTAHWLFYPHLAAAWDPAPHAEHMTHTRDDSRGLDGLGFTFVVDEDGGGTLRPTVSGQDLLAGHSNSRGRDPDDLLPPLSDMLLPTRSGRHVVIGSCTCSYTGCGSLSMIVRRADSVVWWEPFDTGRRETLHRAYGFDLLQYLDAVDTAAEVRPGEGRARRIVREVTRRLLLTDEVADGAARVRPQGIAWISSWPWHSDAVSVLVDGSDESLTLPPHKGETDDQYVNRLHATIDGMR